MPPRRPSSPDAIIGVDIDEGTVDAGMLMVTLTGTAVRLSG